MGRRAIVLAAAAVVVFFGVTLFTLTRIVSGGAPGCAIAAPVPNLPAALRSLGGFDQSFDANSPDELAQVASNAAGAVSPNLNGTTPLAPVRETAASSGQPAAVVVPLTAQQITGGPPRVAGLVSFFVGCGGRAYFGSVDDISSLGAQAPTAFPEVTAASAAARLGTTAPQLVYTQSPFSPEWRDTQSGATIPAGE